MKHLRVIGDFLVRPYEAFHIYKGQYLILSLALQVLLWSPLVYAMAFVMDSVGKSLAFFMAMGASNLILSVALFHSLSLSFGGKGKWQDLVSLIGFTFLPTMIPDLLQVLGVALKLPMRFQLTSTGVLNIMTNGVTAFMFFRLAMQLASMIYVGLAISSVYKIRGPKIVAIVLISFMAISFIYGFIPSVIQFGDLSWQVLPLMLDGVEQVRMSMHITNTVALQPATLERGELVMVRLQDTIFLRTAESANTFFRGYLLAELVAVPGDIVALDAGTLMVNGSVRHATVRPLPHLTMAEIELGRDQYLIYFNSPALLGTETTPELLIITSSQVERAVPQKTLSLLRWITRQ